MRRNDLNTEELRFERLLRTLDRGPAAPDPEFLRQLQDASTAAFVASRPAQPRATRSPTEPPLHPAVGRRRLQAMRVAIFSSVSALLLFGMFSPALFPSRGVELGVAMDNLTRASSYEIEFQNGAGSNTLLFARLDDAAAHWRVDYPSGNAEVSDGAATYFLNRGNNSLHPSPLEEPTITPTFVEDKLLANLNVNGPAEQSSLLKQRPDTVVNQNGQQILVYKFSAPDPTHAGQTLTVNAKVNAENNTLVAMNSEVTDAAGNSKFRANVDVKSVNAAIPIDRFAIDSQAVLSEQIAMVEDVQGLAVVDDLPSLEQLNSVSDGVAVQTEVMNRAVNGSAYNRAPMSRGMARAAQDQAEIAAATAIAGPVPHESAPAEAAGEMQKSLSAPVAASEPQGGGAPGVAGKGAATDKLADRDASSGRLAGVQGQRMMKGFAAPGGGAGQLAAGSQKKLTEDRGQVRRAGKEAMGRPANLQGAPSPAAAPLVANRNATAAFAAEESAKAAMAKGEKSAGQKDVSQSGTRSRDLAQMQPGQSAAAVDQKPAAKRSTSRMELKQKLDFKAAGTVNAKEAIADAETETLKEQMPEEATSGRLRKFQMDQRVEVSSDAAAAAGVAQNDGQQALKQNRQFNSPLGAANSRGGEYGYGLVRRQVAPQTELLPGWVLTTQADPANVVWARLANNADLVVGPGSEVILLKPTEVRLQAGELMLDVPAGDQVDLLGPETPSRIDAENGYRNLRRSQQQVKFSVSRQQVTGRGVFRVENSQLQRVDQEPPWLVDYLSRQNAPGQNSQQLLRQSMPSGGNQYHLKARSGANTQPAAPPPK